MKLTSLKEFIDENLLIEWYRTRKDGGYRKYEKDFPEEESNSNKRQIHEVHPEITEEHKKHLRPYVNTSNKVNPAEVDRNESTHDRKRRESFHSTLHKAIGRDSDKNNMSIKHNAHVFRGQAHAPRLDSSGHMTTDKATSWTTHPGVAHQNAKRNQNEHTSAHHIIALHHRQETGHRMISLAEPVHNHHEEEVVSGPAKYKVTKSTQIGIHKDGKPIIRHDVEHIQSHPHWDASKSGPLSEKEHEIAKNW